MANQLDALDQSSETQNIKNAWTALSLADAVPCDHEQQSFQINNQI